MKLRLLAFIILFGVTDLMPFRAQAETPVVVGQVCDTLGTSTMTTDQKNLVACMRSHSGGLVWKSMTGEPTGTVAFFVQDACPEGWLFADGTHGTIDLRGEFLRVWDGGRGLDKNRTLRSSQGDAIRNIRGTFQGLWAGSSGPFVPQVFGGWLDGKNQEMGDGSFLFDASRVVPTAEENRPHNVALMACQKM